MVAGKRSTPSNLFLELEIHTLHTSYDLSQEAQTSTGQRNVCIRVNKQQSDLRRAVSNGE